VSGIALMSIHEDSRRLTDEPALSILWWTDEAPLQASPTEPSAAPTDGSDLAASNCSSRVDGCFVHSLANVTVPEHLSRQKQHLPNAALTRETKGAGGFLQRKRPLHRNHEPSLGGSSSELREPSWI
jgi:hypothetical protein